MSLKSGVLCSLFTGVSFGDLQRAARGNGKPVKSPSPQAIAHASRFAGSAQISLAVNENRADEVSVDSSRGDIAA